MKTSGGRFAHRSGHNHQRHVLRLEPLEPRVLLSADPLTITGHVTYLGQDGGTHDAAFIHVEAWEKQAIPFTDEKIAEGYTSASGVFTFTLDTHGAPILNEDPGLGESGTRDIYFKLSAENEAAKVGTDHTHFYSFQTGVQYDVSGPVYTADPINFDDTNGGSAWGIPNEIRNDSLWAQAEWQMNPPETMEVYFPSGAGPDMLSGTDGWWLWSHDYCYMRIPETWQGGYNWENSPETLAHEWAHGLQWMVADHSLPPRTAPMGEEDPDRDASTNDHWVWSESSQGFALTEGWAEFFAGARYGNPWAGGMNLETNEYWKGADGMGAAGPNPVNTDKSLGSIDEGAVASILWDLWDGVGDDQVASRSADIWTVFSNDDPTSIWNSNSSGSSDFYHSWNARFGQDRAVDEVFIDHGIPVTDDQFKGNYDKGHADPLNDLDRTYEDLILAYDQTGQGAEDWFSFYLPAEAETDSLITLAYDNRGDIDLALYDSSGLNPVGSLTSVTHPNGVTEDVYDLKGLPKGLYYVKVYSAANDMSPNYDLTLDIAAANAVSVVVVIDDSGSMGDEGKLGAAQTGGTLFVNLMRDGDKVGVVSYTDTATTNFPLTVLDASTAAQVRAAIAALVPLNNTSIGSGVAAADDELDRFPDDPARAMIVLTDGLQNTDPEPVGIINSQVDPNVRIFTIGFGSDADSALLTQMANLRNGQYYFAATPAQLQQIYTMLIGTAGGQQQVLNQQLSISPGGQQTTSASIDPSALAATFGVNWGGSDLDLELIAPDGTVICPARQVLFEDSMDSLGSWAADSPWGMSTSTSHSGGLAATDSPAGDYASYTDASLTLINGIALDPLSPATLTFWTRYELESGYDYGRVEISADGGDWTEVMSLNGYQDAWTQVSVPLDDYMGQEVRVRFRLTTDYSVTYDGWYVDDVAIATERSISVPGVEFSSGPTYEFYRVHAPMPGEWQLRATGVDVPYDNYPYNAYVMVDSAVTASLSTDSAVYETGDTATMRVSLDDGQPLCGASVTALVTPPDSSPYDPSSLTLFDDGAHGDGAANDGVYANDFNGFYWPGSYTVAADVTGISSAGFTFDRSPSMTVLASGTATNEAPVFDTPLPSDPSVILVGQASGFDFNATDADLDPLTYSLVSGPAWLSMDAATGVLSGTPKRRADIETRDVTVRVSDGLGGSDDYSFQLTVQGQVIALGAGLPVPLGSTTFTDASGDLVTVSGKGVGTAYLVRGVAPGAGGVYRNNTPGDLVTIEIVGSNAKSSIAISGKAAVKGVVPTTSVRDIVVTGSLGTLTGAQLRLLGNLTITGSVAKLTLGDVTAQHVITVGTDPLIASMSWVLGRVQDASLTSGTPFKSLSVVEWLDTDATQDVIAAPWISSLTTKGSKVIGGPTGNFQASVTLSGVGAAKGTLGKVSIAGSVLGGMWNITGTAGSVAVRGNFTNSSFQAGLLKSFKVTGLISEDGSDGDADFIRVLTGGFSASDRTWKGYVPPDHWFGTLRAYVG